MKQAREVAASKSEIRNPAFEIEVSIFGTLKGGVCLKMESQGRVIEAIQIFS
jgi:hypothetical protein